MSENNSSPFNRIYSPKYKKEEKELIQNFNLQGKTIQDYKSDFEKIREAAEKEHFVAPDESTISEDSIDAAIANKEEVVRLAKENLEDIEKIKNEIDGQLKHSGKQMFSYTFKRKPRLSRAIKALTGEKRSSITYEDYKKALALKQRIEREDSEAAFGE